MALLLLSGIVLLALAALAGGGWYYSDSLKSGALQPDRDPDKRDLQVVAIDGGQVTLRATDAASDDGDWTKDGTFGLEGPDAYGQVGPIRQIDAHQVTRTFTPLLGLPKVGDPVRLDSFAFPDDPRQAFGIEFQEVAIDSALGELPAWFLDGPRDTWAIFVHGKGASRKESLRMLPSVTDMGFPALAITYRNDPAAPAGPDGFYRYGQTEWEDLQAAAEYALQRGAARLVLIGYSMGGAIVVNFLYQSPLAERVAVAVLDSPVLDFDATVEWGGRNRWSPGFLKTAGKTIAGWRFDIDWNELDYLRRAGELRTPILLFHGDADQKVPVETSDELAAARPDIVTYVRAAGAGHVRSWNADPASYEAAVRDFLARVPP